MTSLALVPYTFSLLKLPLVALQNVADYLNPFEIYKFSTLSKKTKNLAKALSKKAIRVSFHFLYCVSIEFDENTTWYISPVFRIEPIIDWIEKEDLPAYAFFSRKPIPEGLRVLERVIDLFKCSTIHLEFDTRHSGRQNFIFFFNWLMENPSEVQYVKMICSHAEGVEFFLENYKKPSKKLNLVLSYEDDEELELPDNLETSLIEEVEIHNSHAVNFNLYNMFSCSTLDVHESKLTNQDLNTFIKNWQSGLTNSHWRSVCIKMPKPIELEDVLKDITATYRDPRTVKRQINVNKKTFWIFGGVDIENHDGTATATIQWKEYQVENEDSEVPKKFIREYERNTGVILNERDELQANFELWLKRQSQAEFSMYIW